MSIESGYFKKHLQVDLSSGTIQHAPISDAFIEKYVGGRGFGAKLVWDNLVARDFEIDPLGPDNLLVMAPGPLTGLYLPSSGKCSFMAISPATGGYGDSSVGGGLGMSRKDDTMPHKVHACPIRTGATAGRSIDQQQFNRLLDIYYEKRGWDENGLPSKELEAAFSESC